MELNLTLSLTPLTKYEREQSRNKDRRQIEKRARRLHPTLRGIIVERSRRHQMRQVYVKNADKRLKVFGPAMRHRRRGNRVFEDKVPADDPGHHLSQRGIRIGIRRPCDRNHRGKFGVTKRGKDAGQAGGNEGEDQSRPCFVMRGHARQHKDACPDNRAHAQAGQSDRTEDAVQLNLAFFAFHFLQQHFQWFSGKQRVAHTVFHPFDYCHERAIPGG